MMKHSCVPRQLFRIPAIGYEQFNIEFFYLSTTGTVFKIFERSKTSLYLPVIMYDLPRKKKLLHRFFGLFDAFQDR